VNIQFKPTSFVVNCNVFWIIPNAEIVTILSWSSARIEKTCILVSTERHFAAWIYCKLWKLMIKHGG